jgi:GT2 family glycosyltransferase
MSTITYAIIVTYNGSKWVDKCFGSLVNSSIPLHILAIDNASTDGTPEVIRQKYPQVEVIETGKNLGFGKANNIGLKRVLDDNADFAFLLNQDAWVESDTVEKLINSHKSNMQYDLLSPIHLNGYGDAIDRNFQNYLGSFYTPGFYSDLYLNKLKSIYRGIYANAAAWLLTRKCVESVGGFDPLFKHYGEDNDYINRLHSQNLCLAIVPNALIYHDRPQDGKMNDTYYANRAYTLSILHSKNGQIPKYHFLLRRILVKYCELFLVYLGKNVQIRHDIEIDKNILKIKYKRTINLNKNSKYL